MNIIKIYIANHYALCHCGYTIDKDFDKGEGQLCGHCATGKCGSEQPCVGRFPSTKEEADRAKRNYIRRNPANKELVHL